MEFARTRAVLERYAQKLISQYRDNLTSDNSIAGGALYNNITYEVHIDKQPWEVVITLEDYWHYIEDGRRAGGKMPPIKAIADWIEVKPITPKVDSLGRTPTVRQLAFLIARSIGINGIPAKKAFQRAYDTLLDELYDNLRDAVAADTSEYIVAGIKLLRRQ